MEPKPLSSFLEKYKKLPTPKILLKDALEEFLGVPKAIKDVSLRNGTLYIKTSSALKQEIFFKKNKIILFLKERNLGVLVDDIR